MKVISVKEEWRTNTCRVQVPCAGKNAGIVLRSYGRACLHIGLSCGHYVQRFRALDKHGHYAKPTRAQCDECTA